MSDTSAPAAISLRQTTPTMKWVGKECPKCHQPIAVGDQVVLCPKCYTPQHAQCWRDNGNQCAIDQTPARIIERGAPARPAGDAAPAAAPAAPAAASAAVTAPAAPPAPRPAAAPAVAAPAAAAAAPGELANPWRSAVPVQAPPEADLWRRNVMTLVVLIILWAVILLGVYLAGQFGFSPGATA